MNLNYFNLIYLCLSEHKTLFIIINPSNNVGYLDSLQIKSQLIRYKYDFYSSLSFPFGDTCRGGGGAHTTW